jgi:pimeloyl-ACP methyl ester carboxylesterase
VSAEIAHRVIDLGEVRLQVAEAGPEDGPLVLLLHGFPETGRSWRHQVGPLAAAGLRVVVPDQRGYGQSSKPEGIRAYGLDTLVDDVARLIKACGRERAHLVGHDWGGLVAWWAASTRPDLVERLAILNAPHPAVAGSYARRHLTQALRSGYVGFFQLPAVPERLLALGDYALLRRSLTSTSRPGAFSEADLAAYTDAWAEPGALTAMLNWYRALMRVPRAEPADPRIKAPTLVLWGVKDVALERGLATASADLCEQADLRFFEEATHWIHREEVEPVNAALIGVLRP